MTLVSFIRKSVSGVRHGYKTYNKKTVACQSCDNTVRMKINVVIKLLATQEIKCIGCQNVAVPRTVNPSNMSALGQASLGVSGISSLETQRITDSQTDHTNDDVLGDEGEDGCRTSGLSSFNRADKVYSQSQPSLRFGRGSSERGTSGSPRDSYNSRHSTASSNDGSNESLEDQSSTAGQCTNGSPRSSYGSVHRPSISHSNFGLEYCGGESQTALALAQRPLSFSDAGSMDEKSVKEDRHPVLEKIEGQRAGSLLGRRERSLTATSEKSEIRRRSNHLVHPNPSSQVEFENEKHPGSTLVSNSDKGTHSSSSDKLSPRRTSMHRVAISQSYNKKIDQQEEQEQQHEAEKNNAKRRRSMSSDFLELPTEEEVRRAWQIYSQRNNSPHNPENLDLQWARGILRVWQSWGRLRHSLPLTRSVEQLQLMTNGSFESPPPGFYPDPDTPRNHQPFMSPPVSPRLSLLSLLPTPVEEEPEGDSPTARFNNVYSPLYDSSEFPDNPPSSRTRSDKNLTGLGEAPPTSQTAGKELDRKKDKKRSSIGQAIAPKTLFPGHKRINRRCAKAFKSIAGKIFCVPALNSPPGNSPPTPSLTSPPLTSPAVVPQAADTSTAQPEPTSTSTAQPQPANSPTTQLPSDNTSAAGGVADLGATNRLRVEPRSFGPIPNFRSATEEQLQREADAMAASIGMARAPFLQMQVQLPLDTFR